MSGEEKKAIKYFYNLRATIDESNMLFDEDINVKCGNETIKQITLVLNLIEKQQKELENNTERINELINEVTLKDSELDKKDKIINEMGEHIEKGCDFDSTIQTKQEVIEYFTEYATEGE